jgi:hypothetical protein
LAGNQKGSHHKLAGRDAKRHPNLNVGVVGNAEYDLMAKET